MGLPRWLWWSVIIVPPVLLALCRSPFMQRKLVYLNAVKPPLFLFPLNTSKEGFHKSVSITTVDNETLGAWVYNELYTEEDGKVVLYLHGNGGTRGQVRSFIIRLLLIINYKCSGVVIDSIMFYQKYLKHLSYVLIIEDMEIVQGKTYCHLTYCILVILFIFMNL